MNRFAIAALVLVASTPASISAMSPFAAPTADEARAVYRQCLAEQGGKARCAQHRQALIEAADGDLEIVAALDAVDDQSSSGPPVRTRAVRISRVAIAQQ